MALLLLFLTLLLFFPAVCSNAEKNVNIVFLVCESTAGKTYDRDSPVPLKNINRLRNEYDGVSFEGHYSNTPVCCPSRATFWSGRHAHNIPHRNMDTQVNGAWNNFEGLGHEYNEKIFDILEREKGYHVGIFGKQDWSAGSHSDNVRLNAWLMYAQFPYNIPEAGGWVQESNKICHSQGFVKKN
mmetsp:Transcript_16973/g.20413  ORF Transcript_16973/g.20413 Transcript_16973/m.20413 type:complete len:184 (-) Transcript_16973:46-597(-)